MTGPKKAALFLTCANDTLYPEVGTGCVRALEALGVAVTFPEAQTCCGQPWINTGNPAQGRRVARHFLETFEGVEAVVGLSSSCVDTVRRGYPELFADDPALLARAEALAARTWEFCEFLHGPLGVRELPALPGLGRVTYHASCRTLRGVGLRGIAEGYLARLAGEGFVPLPAHEVCCGFGGSFSVKLPEVSGAILADKLDNILATGARTVAALDMSCLTHLKGGAARRGETGLRFVHLGQLIGEALTGKGGAR